MSLLRAMAHREPESKRDAKAPTELIAPLCGSSGRLVLALSALALALLFALAAAGFSAEFWLYLGFSGLLIAWVVACSAAIVCHTRLGRGPGAGLRAQASVLAVVGINTLVISLLIVWFAGRLPMEGLVAREQPLWFVLRNLLIAAIATLFLVRYLVLQQAWREQVRAETRARLESLQARIRPHFLFNTLNTIASLIHDYPDRAEQSTLDLGELLRTGLRGEARHSLDDELELVRGYLRLEALRLGDRLRVDWSLDPALPLDAEIPALLIQPLVENAVVHGIARLPEGGELVISGQWSAGGRLRFVVENPVPDDAPPPDAGNRMALDNIRQRLQLSQAAGARLKTDAGRQRFRAELVIPPQ